jgi:multicomponent Na+:H+ antiporter subunit G
MIELIVSVLLLAGASFMVLAAVGILRLPDLPTRMHASTKAAAMGAMFIMAAVAFFFADSVVVARAFAIVLFILITSPIAAHVIGRAGYFTNTELWEGTVKDELRDNYDRDTHNLLSGYEGNPERVNPPSDSQKQD